MASGKKIYVFNNSHYGLTGTQRQERFTKFLETLQVKLTAGTDDSVKEVTSAASKSEYMLFCESLYRDSTTDGYLKAYPDNVDPLAGLSAHYWTVKGTAGNTSVHALSASNAASDDPRFYQQGMLAIDYDVYGIKYGGGLLGSTKILSTADTLDTSSAEPTDVSIVHDLEIWKERQSIVQDAYAQVMTVRSLKGKEIYEQMANFLVGTPEDETETRTYERGALKNRFWNYTREFLYKKMAEDKLYYNYSTAITAPFTEAEMDACAGDSIATSAKINPEYNFYSRVYEKYLRFIPELALPNLMLLVGIYGSGGDRATGQLARANLTIGMTNALKDFAEGGLFLNSVYWETIGYIFADVMNVIGASAMDPADNSSHEAMAKHFYTIGNQIAKFNPLLDVSMKGQQHLVYTGDYTELIEDSRLKREQFPIHVEIDFNTHQINQFADFMTDADMMPTLIDCLIANLNETGNFEGNQLTREIPDSLHPRQVSSNYNSETPGYNAVFEAEPKIDISVRDDGAFTTDVRYSVQAKRRLEIDLDQFLALFTSGELDTTELKGRLHVCADRDFGTQNTLERQLMALIAKANIKNFVKDNMRTHKQCMNGDLAYNEVIVYRVTKYDAQDHAIQNYWFGNSSKISDIGFVDTQVRYGQTYTYRIYAYTLIIGTKYNYVSSILKPTDMDDAQRDAAWNPATGTEYWTFIDENRDKYNQNNDQKGTFDNDFSLNLRKAVYYQPCLKIVETQIFAQRAMTYDSPPVVPEFEMVPYKGLNNKLLLMFKGAVSRVEEQPITITVGDASYGPDGNQTEEEIQTQQALYQDLSPGDLMLFESDDRPEWFEVYRTTEAPYDYGDWGNKLYARVQTLLPTETQTYPASEINPQYADSASMVDTLAPNTKYYYMVRQVDVHGNPSNPTPMYEVELVDENGMVYPVIREYTFRDRVPSTLNKKFNKYIKIAPTPAQVLINTETLAGDSGVTSAFQAANGNVQLGVSDVNLWGKRFKVRITSETTGKAADINLNFEQKHERTLTEMENSEDFNEEGVPNPFRDYVRKKNFAPIIEK